MGKVKKLPYLDYACLVGERVMWQNILGERLEGVIIEMDKNSVASIKMDDGSIEVIPC